MDKLTITIDSDIINDTLVSDLSTLLACDNEESRTQLFLRIHEVESNDYILMRAQDKTVNVDKNLIQFIEDNPKCRIALIDVSKSHSLLGGVSIVVRDMNFGILFAVII